jgi:electron transport complex protein RnfG
MLGTDPGSEKVLGLKILSHQETPGLGARITDTKYKNNFKEKPFGEYEVIKRKAETPYQVEAISGATISSDKVTDIVEKAIKQVQKVYGGEA